MCGCLPSIRHRASNQYHHQKGFRRGRWRFVPTRRTTAKGTKYCTHFTGGGYCCSAGFILKFALDQTQFTYILPDSQDGHAHPHSCYHVGWTLVELIKAPREHKKRGFILQNEWRGCFFLAGAGFWERQFQRQLCPRRETVADSA